MTTSRQLVVLVDDDVSICQAVQRWLRAAGLTVEAFSSAESLLDSGAAAEAGCFVFDIQLSGLSGFDLHRRLAGIGMKAPVIFITAYDQPSSRAEAAALGAAGYFSKPFPGRELVDAIGRAMSTA
jgi:FixJ family two-component response regulator